MADLPSYRFSRDWYQYTEDDIQLILDAMREKVRLTHEEHYRLGPKRERPPAADRSLLLAVLADVVSHQWTRIDELEAKLAHLTEAVTRLSQGAVMHDDPDADPTGVGDLESPGRPL